MTPIKELLLFDFEFPQADPETWYDRPAFFAFQAQYDFLCRLCCPDQFGELLPAVPVNIFFVSSSSDRSGPLFTGFVNTNSVNCMLVVLWTISVDFFNHFHFV